MVALHLKSRINVLPSLTPASNVDNQVIFFHFCSKNAIFSSIGWGAGELRRIRDTAQVFQLLLAEIVVPKAEVALTSKSFNKLSRRDLKLLLSIPAAPYLFFCPFECASTSQYSCKNVT